MKDLRTQTCAQVNRHHIFHSKQWPGSQYMSGPVAMQKECKSAFLVAVCLHILSKCGSYENCGFRLKHCYPAMPRALFHSWEFKNTLHMLTYNISYWASIWPYDRFMTCEVFHRHLKPSQAMDLAVPPVDVTGDTRYIRQETDFFLQYIMSIFGCWVVRHSI